RPPIPPPFPYTTLFRSCGIRGAPPTDRLIRAAAERPRWRPLPAARSRARCLLWTSTHDPRGARHVGGSHLRRSPPVRGDRPECRIAVVHGGTARHPSTSLGESPERHRGVAVAGLSAPGVRGSRTGGPHVLTDPVDRPSLTATPYVGCSVGVRGPTGSRDTPASLVWEPARPERHDLATPNDGGRSSVSRSPEP